MEQRTGLVSPTPGVRLGLRARRHRPSEGTAGPADGNVLLAGPPPRDVRAPSRRMHLGLATFADFHRNRARP
ncbi:hypothetical protein [Streptomyces sp. NPDC093149]|uniref:hypothetical protein n=1 Tax=Streptomyces sp. NPDC093149 TaxID=3366031 RepID=UPI003817C99A